MPRLVHWLLVALVIAVVGVLPVVWYRASYAHAKRLRIVDPGKVYRSGQMTVEGFREAVAKFGIRTIVNLQDEYPDPALQQSYLDHSTTRETELCHELHVRYVFIALDLLPRNQVGTSRPEAVEKMLEVFDDPSSYPILIHCRAGLHRTGCMAAVYRMEYQGWSPEQAVEEMKDHGFGDSDCTGSNDYVRQYVLEYHRGLRLTALRP